MSTTPADLARLDRAKRRDAAPAGGALGESMVTLFQQQIAKRETKLSKLADVWCRLVPPKLLERCALEGFHRGRLTVAVDSAPHLYELKQLMLAGLEAQLLVACRAAGLRKIVLKRGRWYDDRGEAQF